MTGEQFASLEEALVDFLRPFRACFNQERGFGHLKTYSVGLMTDLKRKSIEPIALAAGQDERVLQWFLSDMQWEDPRAQCVLQQRVANRPGGRESIGVIDSSGHPKRGDKTPGVQRQWCGEIGKTDNCVVGQHLLWTDDHPKNPFSCMLASDLFLPEDWSQDRERCRAAGIPEEVVHRVKWEISVAQVTQALGNGVRFDWLVFDSEYGTVPQFWFALDRLGMRAVGEVRSDFHAWATPPACRSGRAEHASHHVKDLARYSPVFTKQPWQDVTIKTRTRGKARWKVKAAPVQLVSESKNPGPSVPTDRRYWLIVAWNPKTEETKYVVSNAPASASVQTLLRILFTRWHVEKWFERAKQEAGLGAFEVRTYQSLIRHWLICRIVMLFLAEQTQRLRGEKPADHIRAGGRSDERGRLVAMEATRALPPIGVPDTLVPSAA
jgi:SRSO17 transposase